MNVKFIVDKVDPLIDKAVFNETFQKQVASAAERAGLILPLPQIGAGYWQWNLQGDGWTSFSACPEEEKNRVAQEHQKRCSDMKTALKNAPVVDLVLTVPSEECIYYKYQGNLLIMALAAWGFKFHNSPGTRELTTSYTQVKSQDVRIGFLWGEELLPGFNFRLNQQPRQTSSDGYFRSDRPINVGITYPVEIPSGKIFDLTVESGKSDYLYDLSQYFYVEVTVRLDETPVAGTDCVIRYAGESTACKTDDNGVTTLRVLYDSRVAWLEDNPSECAVECEGEIQQKMPLVADQKLSFVFDFVSEKLVVSEPEIVKPEPESEPKTEFVYVYLKDFEGYPLVDLDFTLTTKSRGSVAMKTDHDGGCMIPKDWMSDKDKFAVSFTISPEYQRTHDIHRVKPKKK